MDLINPFEDVSKAETWPPQHATVLRALIPTGAHVGHANDLSVTRNSRGGGGKRTGLEHYRGRGTKLARTKFGKSVERGLASAAGYKLKRVPKALPQSERIRGGLAARQNVNRRNLSMEQLRGSLNFGDAGTRGRRIG